MLKFAFLIITLIALSFASIWIGDHPGNLQLDWLGWRIEANVTVFLSLLLGAVLLLWLLLNLLRYLILAPRRIITSVKERDQSNGLSNLTHAFAALGSSDIEQALKLAQKAEKQLEEAPLTLLLNAQLHRRDGNSKKAIHYLNRMLKHSETEFLAANELGKQARISGNHAQALTYAEHAYKAKPTDRESAYTLAISYSKEGRWQEAERVINQATRKHVFNRTKKAHLLCIILYEQAQRLLAEGNNDSALSFAENAHKKDRQFLPAIMLLAELRLKAGKRLGVSRLIHNTWKYSPHPALAEIFTKLYAGEKSAKQLKQMEKLIAHTPEHVTSQLAVSKLAIALGEFDEARRHLKIAMSHENSKAICHMMAELETALGNKDKANEWLNRALQAEADPAWVCQSCQTVHASWASQCSHCHNYDKISWRTPTTTTGQNLPVQS